MRIIFSVLTLKAIALIPARILTNDRLQLPNAIGNMSLNITSNLPQDTTLKPGQKVYLYSDRLYEEIFRIAIAIIHTMP